MKMNPLAIGLWLFLGCIGWLIGNATGAVVGVAVGLAISFIGEFQNRR